MEPALQELRDRFFRILDEGGPQPQVAHKVWTLFLVHPWFQQELKMAARRVLWSVGRDDERKGDIMQEAILFLRQSLQRAADLHVDRARAQVHFGGWLARIIERDCQQALCAMLASESRVIADERSVAEAQARPVDIEEMIDLADAIARLPAECREVVFLHAQDWSVRQIARMLHTSKSRVGRLLRMAHSLLPVTKRHGVYLA